MITEKVLKTACGDEAYEEMVELAWRVSERKHNTHRMIIARFKISEHKFGLFKSRDKLRNQGIQISSELTHEKRKQVEDAKKEG